MKVLQDWARPISGLLVFALVILQFPVGVSHAAMINTEAFLSASESHLERERVRAFLAREDVRAEFVSLGISPEEATARVDALSDGEVKELAARLDELPAGQNAVGVVIGAILIVFLVLLFTDLIGATDVFPFVKKK
ncbi:MAG: PA2779 family protein [Candidatus Methylomirabilia bacterium]